MGFKPARMPSQRLGANSSGLAAPTHLSTSGRTAELALRRKTLLERSREPLMSIDDYSNAMKLPKPCYIGRPCMPT